MRGVFKLAVGLLVAYVVYRLVSEFVQPARVRLDRPQVPAPPSREPMPDTEPAVPSSPPASAEPRDRVRVNQADTVSLSTLPGIGPTLAERIINHRQQSGLFSTLEELSEVQGIGPALIERLRPLITLD